MRTQEGHLQGVLGSHVVFLQEPYVRKGVVAGWQDKRGLLSAGDQPRAAIYASSQLKVFPEASLSTKDMCVAVWYPSPEGATASSPYPMVYLVSLYLDIKHKAVCPPDLYRLLDLAEDSGVPVLIGSDTNCHSTLWGSPTTNARGLKFENIVSRWNLEILNVGSVPTFHSGKDPVSLMLPCPVSIYI